MIDVLEAVSLGLLFGWSLQRAGLTQYARIVNVYRLRDMTVIRFMLTALVVGAVVIQAGVDLGVSAGPTPPPTAMLANLVGGLVFGVGMATAGYCPGTIVAEIGEGRLDALVGGLTGLIAGAIVFGLLEPVVMPVLTPVGALGRVTVAGLTGASPWLVVLVFAETVGLVLLVLSRRRYAGGDADVSVARVGRRATPKAVSPARAE